MANNVTVSALGAPNQTLQSISTVADAALALNLGDAHSVVVNGEPATYDTSLSDFNFVAFGEQVKGGDIEANEAWAYCTSFDANELHAYL